MRAISLFTGGGGLDLAAELAGIHTVAMCEREPYPRAVLQKHWPHVPIYDDVCTLTDARLKEDGIIGPGRTIDVIHGGFPCQPFSHAGKRGGTEDDRYLWPAMFRIISEVRPTWVIAENVDGLLSMEQSDSNVVMEDETTICEEAEMVLETIRRDFEKEGYETIILVLPAAGVGAPHRRYRIFILGYTERSGCGGESWGRSETLADTEIQRRDNGHDSPDVWQTDREVNTFTDSGSFSRETKNVADTSGARWQEFNASTVADQSGYSSRSGSAKPPRGVYDLGRCGRYGPSSGESSNGTTQPGMGGMLDGLSDWLDRYRPRNIQIGRAHV